MPDPAIQLSSALWPFVERTLALAAAGAAEEVWQCRERREISDALQGFQELGQPVVLLISALPPEVQLRVCACADCASVLLVRPPARLTVWRERAFGLVFEQGIDQLFAAVQAMCEATPSPTAQALGERLAACARKLRELVREDEVCQSLSDAFGGVTLHPHTSP